MPKPIRLSHAVLKTYDVSRMRDWYCAALEAHVVFELPGALCFITYDDEHHRLGFAQLPGAPVENTPKNPGLAHLAFTYANIRDLLSQYERLRDRGLRPAVAVNHGPTISLYYMDPEGNGVEFLIDRFTTSEEATAFMTGPIFKKNPVGVDIDPEALLAAMRAGAGDEELTSYDADKAVDTAEIMARHRAAMHVD